MPKLSSPSPVITYAAAAYQTDFHSDDMYGLISTGDAFAYFIVT